MSEAMRDPPRRPKGHQPHFFDDPAIDQLHAAVIALASELSVAFDRIDTLERLLERDEKFSREQIDAYAPDAAAQTERSARRADIAERILRPFIQYREDLLERAAHAKHSQETNR